ncbi:E2F8 factor, partial [Amia calva]|nr:E2F8 factor [Amia calva]
MLLISTQGIVFVEPQTLEIKTPQKVSTSRSVSGDSQQEMGSLTTPTKGKDSPACEPWTPTANLKILISAASPEIRNREKELCLEDTDVTAASDCSQEHIFGDDPDKLQTSRKEKSLGLLCHKFLARYPDYPNPAVNNDICLDEVAEKLSVERRRIYDIVNVLESLHMVSRLAKNRYTWHGRGHLTQTLRELRRVGEDQKYAEQMQHIKQKHYEREFDSDNDEKENEDVPRPSDADNEAAQKEMYFVELPGMEFRAASVNSRKDKSLRVMSQKFVMLFLVSKPRVVSLEVAAKILIGEDQVVDLDKSKFKTKIRRLYDIANVLSSLELITKVHVTEERGRKPAFKWTGPEDFPAVKGETAPSTTTSLPSGPLESRSSIENCTKKLFPASSSKHSFTRHASLVKLAKSIQDDRRKINSAPTSPVKMTSDSTDSDLYPSRMAQLAAICKLQLDEQSKKSKRKPKHDATNIQKPKGKTAKTTGAAELLSSKDPSVNTAAQTKTPVQPCSAVPCAPSQYAQMIPVILPQNPSGAPYAIYLHTSVRPVANPASLAVRSMTFEEKTGESPSDNVDGGRHRTHAGKDAAAAERETDGSQKNRPLSPERGLKRSRTGTHPGDGNLFLPVLIAVENMSYKTFLEIHLPNSLKARRGLVSSRPSPRALHLDPEFINTPENRGSEQLDESVEKFLEKDSDSEAGLTPLRTVQMQELIVPSGHLHAEALIPTGYLIPISQQSLFGYQGSQSPDGEGAKIIGPCLKSYQTPITAVTPTSFAHGATLPHSSPSVSVASFPVLNQSSPSFAPGQRVSGPSPAIINFTLQNLGLISAGSPSAMATPTDQASPVPAQLSFQPGGMIFVKPMSPIPLQQQLPGQAVTLISLQQPALLTTPKGNQSAQQSFFHTPVSALSPLATVASKASPTVRQNVYIPQRKLEVSTEDQ